MLDLIEHAKSIGSNCAALIWISQAQPLFTAVMEWSDETLAGLCLAMIAASFAVLVWISFS